MKSLDWVSTGVPGLDEIINHLRTGDNVVLQVDSIEEYIQFVGPFVRNSVNTGKRVVYMRFARHKPIVPPHDSIAVYEINADNGFESFTTQVHEIITAEGEGAFYVFDCLSRLKGKEQASSKQNLRVEQRKPENYFKAAGGLKDKMLKGRFPENIRDQFIRMLEYFGQSPIIVRSSSLLEDGFGNAHIFRCYAADAEEKAQTSMT